MADTAKSITAEDAVTRRALRLWLSMADGSLPGEFLRMQGLNPTVLVAQGLLSVGAGRWSDFYVTNPSLRSSSIAPESLRC